MTRNNVLCLDGGGAKGIYTLGILHEVESSLGEPIANHFDYFYGTSTGAIIAALIADGKSVKYIKKLYLTQIPSILSSPLAYCRTKRLTSLLKAQFGERRITDIPRPLAIVSSSIENRRPTIFKSSEAMAHTRKSSFAPGFDRTIVEILRASCAAYPFLNSMRLKGTDSQASQTLLDGGFVANNPTLFAMIDMKRALGLSNTEFTILSVGTGAFPIKYSIPFVLSALRLGFSASMVSLLFDLNSNTTDIIVKLLLSEVPVLRVNGSFTEPHLATNLLETNRKKLELLFDKGRDTFGAHETQFNELFKKGNDHANPS